MRAVDSVDAARAGNVKVNSVMRSKQLQLNPDKTSYIMFGRKKDLALERQETERSPIMCGNFITREKVMDKWLGDIFHQDGLAAYVRATLADREAKVKGAFYEAVAIVCRRLEDPGHWGIHECIGLVRASYSSNPAV